MSRYPGRHRSGFEVDMAYWLESAGLCTAWPYFSDDNTTAARREDGVLIHRGMQLPSASLSYHIRIHHEDMVRNHVARYGWRPDLPLVTVGWGYKT